MMRIKQHAGFSLLEAIVALAILASVGMALFAAMNQALSMVSKAEDVRMRESVVRNAVAWMQTINPGIQPEGEHQLGDIDLRWTSKPLEAPRDGVTNEGLPGLYRVGIYQVRLELDRDGKPLAELEYQRAGFEQVRRPGVL